MKLVLDGADKEMGQISIETKDMPQGFLHQMQPLYDGGKLYGFIIQFCLIDQERDG